MPEILFAAALLACEPEKIKGGSKARQEWLGLVIAVQIYLIEHGYDVHLFMKNLNGEPHE